MNTRLALYELAARHGLPRQGLQSLLRAAGFEDEPASLWPLLWRGVAVLAAALLGLGVILWLAANWDSLGRAERFALLQFSVLVLCIGAAALPGLRAPLGLAALLCIGGLFAFFGQTYQTGADAWQLFALWAVLALPLCLGARSDVLWAPWSLVVMTAVSLWTYAHTGHHWRVEPQDLGTYAFAWLATGLLTAALSPIATRWTGAGIWALRTAATLAVASLTLAALGGLFHSPVAPHYALALVLLVLSVIALARRRGFDLLVLSVVVLGLDTLLVAGLAKLLLEGVRGDPVGQLLLLGLSAAGLLACSVSGIMKLARHHGHNEESTP